MRGHRFSELAGVLASIFSIAILTACGGGGGSNATGADAAAKASGKLVSKGSLTCDKFKDVDLRPVLAAVSVTDAGSPDSCAWEMSQGHGGNGDPVEDVLRVTLEDGIPATYADYVAANKLDTIASNGLDDPASAVKELKAAGWTYGYQFSVEFRDGHPTIAYFYDAGKGHGFSCTVTYAVDGRLSNSELRDTPAQLAKVEPWLDGLRPKVLDVCSELLAAARS